MILQCTRAELGGLTAIPESAPWNSVAPANFADAVTGNPPAQSTEIRAAWSKDEWRLLFVASDTDPWATMTQRDAPLYEEETVEVFFDPFGDLQTYFEIEVNPLGTVLDLFFRKSRSGYKGDIAWDCGGFRAVTKVDDGRWITEMAIPFASVADAPPNPGTQWRANFCRIDRPVGGGRLPRELSAWSPPMRANFHTPERFGVIQFH